MLARSHHTSTPAPMTASVGEKEIERSVFFLSALLDVHFMQSNARTKTQKTTEHFLLVIVRWCLSLAVCLYVGRR